MAFGSRLHAGVVDGWKKAQKLLAGRGARKLVLFATGAMPNEAEDTIQKMWGQNLTPAELDAIPHFYLQAGLCYERMGGVDRAMMKLAAEEIRIIMLSSTSGLTVGLSGSVQSSR